MDTSDIILLLSAIYSSNLVVYINFLIKLLKNLVKKLIMKHQGILNSLLAND